VDWIQAIATTRLKTEKFAVLNHGVFLLVEGNEDAASSVIESSSGAESMDGNDRLFRLYVFVEPVFHFPEHMKDVPSSEEILLA